MFEVNRISTPIGLCWRCRFKYFNCYKLVKIEFRAHYSASISVFCHIKYCFQKSAAINLQKCLKCNVLKAPWISKFLANTGFNYSLDWRWEAIKTEDEWKKTLTPQQYHVLREKGTEPPFTGKLLKNKKTGMYVCAACGNQLFSSDTKFDSGTGWPSFWEAVSKDSVELHLDNRFGMKRIEVACKKCNGHLGHVFNDSPTPSGRRFCINSISLDFEEQKDSGKKQKDWALLVLETDNLIYCNVVMVSSINSLLQ